MPSRFVRCFAPGRGFKLCNRIVILPPDTGKPGDYVIVRIASATALALYAEGVRVE